MSEYRYTILFEPAEEGGYIATCLALPGLVTEGDTLDEAREMPDDTRPRHIIHSVHSQSAPPEFSGLPCLYPASVMTETRSSGVVLKLASCRASTSTTSFG